MDPDHLQTISQRDQLWASLRALQPDIERLAEGEFDGSDRERQIQQILAKVIQAELQFRAMEAK
ncbi:MAG: hypothetical protein ACJ8FY_08845 [Gemmataceae bacterium]